MEMNWKNLLRLTRLFHPLLQISPCQRSIQLFALVFSQKKKWMCRSMSIWAKFLNASVASV